MEEPETDPRLPDLRGGGVPTFPCERCGRVFLAWIGQQYHRCAAALGVPS